MTQYWFRPKRYGYGASPITWEVWAVTFAFAAVLVVSIVAMEWWSGRTNIVAWLIWGLFVAATVWWFVQFSRRRTDGECRWRWGNKPGAAN